MTEVRGKDCGFRISKDDSILILGSCFAANIGERLLAEGYDVCLNPFGTLFNPSSVAQSLERLASARPFTGDECVQMGAGSEFWCSFSHYTKFARASREEFLENANAALASAADFFRRCNKVIVTFGTAYVFEHESGRIVSNCLKRPAKEFKRYRLSVEDIYNIWYPLLDGILDGREVLFTVSPIRHMADTAHGNQLSKSTLLLAVDKLLCEAGKTGLRAYYPAYEIVLDELRDYRWFASDEVHPSAEAVEYIWNRFKKDCCSAR
ncbi:MAG: GSCFA domain-containing protein [Bacteroidales bacterium]|nr:GSCFA domain-containing protein [Bacteroidales bacterium]